MARTLIKEYWYVNNSLGVIQSDHPGRDKSGDPKTTNKKGVICWTEKGRDCWWFPDGSTQPCSEEDYGRTQLLGCSFRVDRSWPVQATGEDERQGQYVRGPRGYRA